MTSSRLHDWQQACRALGLPDGSPAECVAALRTLLADSAETPARRQRARDCLELLPRGGSSTVLTTEVLELLYPPSSDSAAEQAPCDAPASLDDPAWNDIPRRLAGEGADPIRYVGDRLVQLLQVALSRNGRASSGILRERLPLLRGMLALDGLSSTARLRLKAWVDAVQVAEAQKQAQHLYRELCRLRSEGRWNELLSSCLPDSSLLTPEQATGLGELERLIEDYRQWRELYERLRPSLENWFATAERPLPWPDPMVAHEVEALVQGATRWLPEGERAGLRQTLDRIAQAACERLSAPDAREVALSALERCWGQWRNVAGEVAAPLWEAAVSGAWSAIEAQFEAWADHLARTLEDPFFVPPRLPYRNDRMRERLDRLQAEVRQLEELQGLLYGWLADAGPQLAASEELAEFDGALERLRPRWAEAPVLRRLLEGRADLGCDLDTLGHALALRDEGRLDEAIALLRAIPAPFALRWLEEVEAQNRALELERRLRSGEWARFPAALSEGGPEIRRLWERLRAGRAELERLEAGAVVALTAHSLVESAVAVQRLLLEAQALDSGLCDPDLVHLRHLRARLADGLLESAEAHIARARAQSRPYPLLEAERCAQLMLDLAEVEQALAQPALAHVTAELGRSLAAPAAVVEIHSRCHALQWEAAEQSLAAARARFLTDPATLIPVPALAAAIAEARAQTTGADPSARLHVCLDHQAVLLETEPARSAYLGLLREAAPIRERLGGHLRALERRFPDQVVLRGLLRLTAEMEELPQELAGGIAPHGPDAALLARLLPPLAEALAPLTVVTRLADLLGPLPGADTNDPVALHAASFSQWMGRLIDALGNEQRPVREIAAEVERVERQSGRRLPDADHQLIRHAVETEGFVEALAEQDPWEIDGDLMVRLREQERRESGPFAALSRRRGWAQALRARMRGHRAARLLETQWQERLAICGRERRGMNFQHDANGWEPLIQQLEIWVRQLEECARELDWDLPGAAKSRFWLSRLYEWRQSPEGRLALARGAAEPANPAALAAFYADALVQMRDFAQLHRGLLEFVEQEATPGRNGVPAEVDAAFRRLRDCEPLSRPVDELARRLMNPDASRIGRAYEFWEHPHEY